MTLYRPAQRGTSRLIMAAVMTAALALTACSGPSAETPDSAPNTPAAEPSLEFAGPGGEETATLDDLQLTTAEIEEVNAGTYTAAFVWHTSSEFVSATEKGARAKFDELGIEVVASTQADFDPAIQANNLETVLALDPDIIVTIAADPTSAQATFQPAVDAGVKLVIMTTPPAGYTAGEEFVSIATVSLTEQGKLDAEMLGEALGGQGEIGYLYHDADFWFTNQRDQAFKDWTAFLHPDVEIVAEEGFTDEAATQEIAAAMLARNPNIKGIYVAWATAAQGVLSALRDAGRMDVKVVTNDLDATLAADMVNGGNVIGLVGNASVDLGTALATIGAYGVLEKKAPALVAVTPLAVTADTIVDGWQADYGVEPPASVTGD
ncbi:MAG: LacI family transcriptional regulator [Homoserinimonas sp.]|jgi:ribose transport system substrate-binding protein|nr:LacI family transcriptional regulator [Homoserinimonas sp.]